MDNSESCNLLDFTVIRKLGAGGFGSAYLARRNSDEEEVCLKVLPLSAVASEQEIQREARMLSELNNEYIIRYYGSFVESEHFYIMMEYAKGGSLAEMIAACCYSTVFI